MRKVFEAIYYHKAKIKTVEEIHLKTGLTRMRVLQLGKALAHKNIVRQKKKDGDTAYETIDFFQGHKKQILALAGNPKKLAKLPTKRKFSVAVAKVVQIRTEGAKVDRITIDDIDSFKKVRGIEVGGSLPSNVSENRFKQAIKKIIGEPGKFKDWGGEKSDLYSTRIWMKGARRAAAFAFKGPGEKGRLTPGRMGKNGDQGLRLFHEDADVFIVQHWRDIDSSVIEMLRSFAIAKSVTSGRKLWFGVIDGNDSERIRLAYPTKFK
jgi:hypothetical protein